MQNKTSGIAEFRMGGRCDRHPLSIIPCSQCASELTQPATVLAQADKTAAALDLLGLDTPALQIRRLQQVCAALEAENIALKSRQVQPQDPSTSRPEIWVDLSYIEVLDALGRATSWLEFYRDIASQLKNKNT